MVSERRAAGETLTDIGRELDVCPDQLRAWARLAREASGAGEHPAAETLEQENRRLRRELAPLRQEQAFEKKRGGVLREVVAVRYAVIARHRDEFPV